MTAFSAWREGIRRVARAPAILGGLWIATLAVSLPLALGLRAEIEKHLGSSLAADTAASGVNYDWMQEFGDQASSLGVTLRPTIIGFGAVLDNLSGFLDNVQRPIVIVSAGVLYLALWIFVAGGIIDRYARNRPTGVHGFFAASGVFFLRFVRLAAIMGVVYGFLFRYLHPWLFDRFYSRLINEVAVERTAFFMRVALYIVFGLVLAACNLVFDYAKVRAVVEDRRSMVGAVTAAIGFIGRNAGGALLLFVVNFGVFAIAVGLYALIAPGAGSAGLAMWLGVAVGQAYVLARLWIKLTFWASETALFQGRLGHAGYVVRVEPMWPESPAADAI
jgi:hypothetical protein